MTFLLIYLCMVIQYQYLVSAGNVISHMPHTLNKQLTYPWYRNAVPTKTAEVVVKSPSGQSYTVRCRAYEDQDPKLDIYSENGWFVDTLAIVFMDQDPCGESFLRNYITPQDLEKKQLKMIYLWAGKSPTCVERTYMVNDFPYMSTVLSFSYPKVDCPDTVTQFVRGFPKGKMAGGIVNVGPLGRTTDLDFNQDVISKGTPTSVEFPTKDLKGKVFKLICREDTLKSKDPDTSKNTIITGMVVHQDNDEIILEKFKLDSCSVDSINVNRKIVNNINHFKTVYKTTTGECYERHYEEFDDTDLYYFTLISVMRLKPREVKCPKSFVGDIDINASRPFLSNVIRKVLRKPVVPYAVEKKVGKE